LESFERVQPAWDALLGLSVLEIPLRVAEAKRGNHADE
jgi:hypothetical protein